MSAAVGGHVRDCPKVVHELIGGYLHAADDDGPYMVDGVSYCGRCHCWLAETQQAPQPTATRAELIEAMAAASWDRAGIWTPWRTLALSSRERRLLDAEAAY
jgi:hypothetical protein